MLANPAGEDECVEATSAATSDGCPDRMNCQRFSWLLSSGERGARVNQSAAWDKAFQSRKTAPSVMQLTLVGREPC